MGMADVAKEYMAKLFGAPAVAYNVNPSQWVGMQQPTTPQQQTATNQPNSTLGRSGDGNERAQGEAWADRGGIPTVNSPDYWAGQFTPDIGWKDVLKAYGPSIAGALTGNPMMVGLNMARMYKNPTQDPLWQKAATQYLDSIGNPASLADVIGQINGLYKTNLDSKVFASDTARGALLGLGNPTQWGQASSYGMAPHQFAQSMSGYNYAGINPTGANTFEMFSSSPTYDSLRSMGYSNAPQSSFLADYAKMLGTGQIERGGLTEQAMERGIASANARDTSNKWMDDVLNGRTTKTFADWKNDTEGRGVYGIDQDGNEVGNADHSGIGSTGDGYGDTGDPSGRIR